MHFEMELPMIVVTPIGMLSVAVYNLRLEIERGEDGGWCVDGCAVWGQYGTEPSTWHSLACDHEISRATERLAHTDWRQAISDKWSEHLWNNPPLRRRAGLRVIAGREN